MLRRYWRTETILFLVLWLVLMLAGRSRLFRDPGALWHIVVGERILSHRELVYTDPFSCTFAGKPWIAQWWLGECILALIHQFGKLDAVLLATATLLACLYTWLGHRLLRAGMHPLPAALVVALAVLASSYHFHPRPHLLTLVLLGWTFARLCDFEAGRTSLASLFWLVPLYVLWTNVHGGMVGGVATIAAAAAGWGLAKLARLHTPLTSYRQLLLLGVLVLACGLTALLNPYGLKLPRVWFELMDSPVLPRIIQEHAPLLASGPVAWTVVPFAVLYLAALLGVSLRQVRVTWLLPLLWFALAWTRIRHGPLFVITAALALGEMYPHVRWREWLARRGSITSRLQATDSGVARPGQVWRPALLPALLVLAALALEAAALPVPVLGSGWARLDPETSPIELLPELRSYGKVSPPETPIFNDMLFGGFLIYFTPNLKVFVDDRCELYGDRWLEQYAEAYYHHPERIEAWAQEYGFDRALVVPDTALDRYLREASGREASGWAVVRRTAGAVLYRRTPATRKTTSSPTGRATGRRAPGRPLSRPDCLARKTVFLASVSSPLQRCRAQQPKATHPDPGLFLLLMPGVCRGERAASTQVRVISEEVSSAGVGDRVSRAAEGVHHQGSEYLGSIWSEMCKMPVQPALKYLGGLLTAGKNRLSARMGLRGQPHSSQFFQGSQGPLSEPGRAP